MTAPGGIAAPPGPGRYALAAVRGSIRTAAKMPLAAIAITTNSGPKPQPDGQRFS